MLLETNCATKPITNIRLLTGNIIVIIKLIYLIDEID